MAVQRNWMFTINNPTEEDNPTLWEGLGVRWCCWQKEKGQEGTEHYQGYAQLEKKSRLSALKKINSRAHWEPRKGSHQQAKQYVTKADTRVDGPFEYGDPVVTAGQRTDVEEVKKALKEGKSDYHLWENHTAFMMKNHRAVNVYRRVLTQAGETKRKDGCEVIILWGEAGAGKTTKAMEMCGEDVYWKPRGNWWDGYEGQETVVIDEFYGWLPFDDVCRMVNMAPWQVETKGGSAAFRAHRFIITSNKAPKEWYDWKKCCKQALSRRVTKIYYLGFEVPNDRTTPRYIKEVDFDHFI